MADVGLAKGRIATPLDVWALAGVYALDGADLAIPLALPEALEVLAQPDVTQDDRVTDRAAWMGWQGLADHADVSVDTILRWSKLPGFPSVSRPTGRLPRINVATFDAWLQAQQAPSAPGVDEILAEIRARKRA